MRLCAAEDPTEALSHVSVAVWKACSKLKRDDGFDELEDVLCCDQLPVILSAVLRRSVYVSVRWCGCSGTARLPAHGGAFGSTCALPIITEVVERLFGQAPKESLVCQSLRERWP